jgi:predicted DsbA family dithiol-disulfide isomerase
MEKVKVEVWSDMVCPYCYLGKRKLQKAIRMLQLEKQVELVWHSYQLDPAFPLHRSIPSSLYLTQKGYPEGQLRGMQQQLTERGRPYGISFDFEQSLYFNTLDAHRLWQWSKQSGRENEFKEAVFAAHFSDGIDLSVPGELIRVAAQAGLPADEAQQVLESGAFSDEVEADIYQSRQLGIRGVPYFLINESLVISGAQDDRVFETTLGKFLPLTPSPNHLIT